MPDRIIWTPEIDGLIRRRRDENVGWVPIAQELKISRTALKNHALKIGLRIKGVSPPRNTEPKIDLNRPPMPAGNPVSWAILTAGTWLEGTAYQVEKRPYLLR